MGSIVPMAETSYGEPVARPFYPLKIFLRIVTITLIVRVSLMLMGVAIANTTEWDFKNKGAFTIGRTDPLEWASIFWRFDTDWYHDIAQEGHLKIDPAGLLPNSRNGQKPSYYGFFPLYPFLIAAFMKLTGASFLSIAWWISLFTAPVAFFLFYHIALFELKAPDKAWLATLCIMLFPFNYYYYVFYTETLYLLILLSSFLSICYQRFAVLYISMVFLALIRPNGVFSALPLVIWYAEIHDPGLKKLFNFDWRPWVPICAAIALLTVTLIFYCYYMYVMTGDPLAFSTAQKGWLRSFKWPWKTILHASGSLDPLFAIFTLLMLAFVIATFSLWRLSFVVMLLVSVTLPLATGLNTSMPRYWSTIFPVFIIMGNSVAQWKYRSYAAYILWLFMLINFVPWVIGHSYAV